VALDGHEQSLAQYLEDALRKGKDLAVEQMKKSTGLAFPNDFTCKIDLEDCPGRSTKITVECRWKRYQGRLCASLLNGSYCVNTGHFAGTESVALPVTYPPPASDWEELSVNPPKASNVKSLLFTKNSAGLMAELRKHLAGKFLTVSGHGAAEK
jgi:hypothetical protein